MSVEIKFKERSDSIGKIIKIPCQKCSGKTNHEIKYSLDYNLNETEYGYFATYEYQTLVCRGCEIVSFRTDYYDSEDIGVDDETGETYQLSHELLYPPRSSDRKQLDKTYELPPNIKRIYEETINSLLNQSLILSGVGIRALVESSSQALGAKGKNLEKKIDNLAEIGIITKDGAELLHSTRLLGNTAAHEIIPLPENDLLLALDVVENLLQNAFILPKIYKSFKAKYPKQKNVSKK